MVSQQEDKTSRATKACLRAAAEGLSAASSVMIAVMDALRTAKENLENSDAAERTRREEKKTRNRHHPTMPLVP